MKKEPRKKRHRFVSGHALERLRERIIQLDLDYRLDADLEQWLDANIEDAIRRGHVEAIMDRDEPARLANISENLGAPAFALIKTNTHEKAEYSEVVVTIMDDVMVNQYRTSRWRDRKFRPLANGLAKIKLPISKPKPIQPEPMKIESIETPPEKPAVDELLLITYNDLAKHVLVKSSKLKMQLTQLALNPDIDNKTIQVWKSVPTNIQVSVEVEL